MQQIRINNFDELIDYLRTSTLQAKQIETIVSTYFKVCICFDHTKDELIEILIAYWTKWGNTSKYERPIFLDLRDPLDMDAD